MANWVRKLPFELQVLLQQSIPACRTPGRCATSITTGSRRCITLSAVTRPPVQFIAEQSTPVCTQVPLFEQNTAEYNDTPLSRLDHPGLVPREQPRSPQQALIALLDNANYEEAETLRHDLIQSGQFIEPHIEFARHAQRLFTLDPSSSTWLDWWTLAPTLTSLATTLPLNQVRSQRKQLSNVAEAILESLLQLDDRNWHRTRQFAALLSAQGHSKLVSEHLLVHLAAYAPFEISEQVWQTQLDCLKQRYLAIASIPALQADPTKSNRTVREWYADAVHHETHLLSLKRQKMLKTHAAFGRLNLVLELIDGQRSITGPGNISLRLKKSTLVWIMAIAAASDRYDIFSRIYSELRSSGGRLTRVKIARLRNYIPYFARGSEYDATDAPPSAAEAFATWRYRQHKSNLEEGFLEGDEADSSKSLLAQEMASARPDFGRATHLFRVALTEQRLPFVHVTASYIRSARAQGRTEILSQLSDLLVPTKGVRERLAKHWQTATLLADVQEGNLDAAVRRYMRYWLYSGLDETIVSALIQATQDRKRRGVARKFRFTTDAYVLSLVVEALVPLLEPDGRQAGTSPLVEQMYDSLVTESPRILPRWSAATTRQTPLDPHTFTPFMTRLARRQAPPQAALEIVLDMQRLGLSPTPHQLAILVASYARRGSPADVFYLLDLIEGEIGQELDRTTTMPNDVMLKRLRTRPAEGESETRSESTLGPNVIIVYTGAVTGLAGQDEWHAARRVIERLRVRHDGNAVMSDQAWRRAVGWVQEWERGQGAGTVGYQSVAEERREQARMVSPLTV